MHDRLIAMIDQRLAVCDKALRPLQDKISEIMVEVAELQRAKRLLKGEPDPVVPQSRHRDIVANKPKVTREQVLAAIIQNPGLEAVDLARLVDGRYYGVCGVLNSLIARGLVVRREDKRYYQAGSKFEDNHQETQNGYV